MASNFVGDVVTSTVTLKVAASVTLDPTGVHRDCPKISRGVDRMFFADVATVMWRPL
ncbi:MAG: hypothetical protein IJ774_00830 [Selenomonadaceae bacterium]|nr:hypothetical protein [Selenomonadaceae bacterium]